MQRLPSRPPLFKQRRFRLLLLGMVLFSLSLGFVMVLLERAAGRNLTFFDGIWWAVSTMTTVGYGDVVPLSVPGRLIGMVLQVVGAVMFGMVVAMMSLFINRSQDEFYWNRLFERIDRLEEANISNQRKTEYLVKETVIESLSEEKKS